MTDIVERLRTDAKHHEQVANDCDCRPEDTVNWQHALNCIQAAEIIEQYRLDSEHDEKLIEDMRSQVERLNKALGSIARGLNGKPITGKDAQLRARDAILPIPSTSCQPDSSGENRE